MLRVFGAALSFALLLSGCSGAAPVPDAAQRPAAPAAPQPGDVNVRYQSVFDIRQVVEAAGTACDTWEVYVEPGQGSVERAACTSWMLFTIHTDATAVQTAVSETTELLTAIGLSSVFLTGPNWSVNCGSRPDTCRSLRDVIGGVVQAN